MSWSIEFIPFVSWPVLWALASVGVVLFAPRARTNWHRHPGGRFLFAVSGRGRVRSRGGEGHVLEAGDVAAADARLHTAHALTTNEAPLTGGSAPVEKTTAPTTAETPLAERHDFVFMGTSVATGTGLAEVVATGMQTELGRIAHLLSTAEESVTPLQRRLARVSQTLLHICGGIVAVVALAGLLRK